MTKRLIVDLSKCTECRSCELICSFAHFGVFNSKKSGIRIVPDWPNLPAARLCIQCEDPACIPACPTVALVRNSSGAVSVIREECIGCGDCVVACPYDGIWLDPLTNISVKCDTCDGEFKCIEQCFVHALSIGDEDGSPTDV